MSRVIGIGKQNFESIIRENLFYIDKTGFIREWWENQDDVTLITRPRRFGKTLTLNMVETFFSVDYNGRKDLFEGLSILQDEKYRDIQGTYPVISISFAGIKENDYKSTKKKICQMITDLYSRHRYLTDTGLMSAQEKRFFSEVSADMEDYQATIALQKLCSFLYQYYRKKVIILLDEYDTPMQEAYVDGYWAELVGFTRSLFNSTFKTNPFMERAVMTGITRVSKESVFSDLNNLVIITTTSELYADSFGFTQEEVRNGLAEYGLENKFCQVKDWYDGFDFGSVSDIYNPWSILNYMKFRKFEAYWANTSSNSLISRLIQEGSADVKMRMEDLMKGKSITVSFDEQVVYSQLDESEEAIWSLLLASGYLKARTHYILQDGEHWYELELTNQEVRVMFRGIIKGWFKRSDTRYNDFVKALLSGDLKAMNVYMNHVSLSTFSYFDTGKNGSSMADPEWFYHGFVLGLMVELADRYHITSNRESGFGRYDVVLEPGNKTDDAFVMEFKSLNAEEERDLEETAEAAIRQIKEKAYAADLEARGIPGERIRLLGFAFQGKKVLIKKTDFL